MTKFIRPPKKALLMRVETNMLLMSPVGFGKAHITGVNQLDIETGKLHVVVVVTATTTDGDEEIGAALGATDVGSAVRDEVEKIDVVEENLRDFEAADKAKKIVTVWESVEEISEFASSEAVGVEKIGAVLVVVEIFLESTSIDVVRAISFYSKMATFEAIEKNEAVSDCVKESSETIEIVADHVEEFVQFQSVCGSS